MGKRLGIYVHIPFCASKCSYCDFYSLAKCDQMMPAYQKALLAHIRESAAALKNYEVDTIYFGGGTPSFYGADRIVEIFNELKLNGNVRVDAEVTVECNPDSTSLNALKLLRSEGVNRISMGVQATDNDLLKLIGRRHNYRQVVAAVQNARDAGFENLSLDLMYGLPSQTKADWATTLSEIVKFHPEHLSCYGLKLEPGTPMYENYRNSPVLPDDDEQADMYSYCVEMLAHYGYEQYEISNFSIPGYASRHNLKYWNREDYMGFGPGAHSCIGNQRYSFVSDLKTYISGVSHGTSLVDEHEIISQAEAAVEYVMLAMRTVHGMSEYEYRVNSKCRWEPMEQVLQAFRSKGWCVCDQGQWHFTTEGFLISNTLIGILLETQNNNRVENTPWLGDFEQMVSKISYPKSEDEKFSEQYGKRTEPFTEENE